MDQAKTGILICERRKALGLTQKQLADKLNVSDKAVSKWERGLGCPDVSLLTRLCNILGVDAESLLSGELNTNESTGGNMKKLKFYICPTCGNLITSTSDAAVSCCGQKLSPLTPIKVSEEEKLSVEIIENDYFISSSHEMSREHYISFVALLTGDSIILRKRYPEWNLDMRIPRIGHGTLIWYCTVHGLQYQLI